MFRLVFLAFHGERRHEAPDEHPAAHSAPAPADAPAHGTGTGTGAGHGHAHLHDAPPSMAYVLIALAIGSVLAGFIGVPHALGGSNRIETFLHPSFVASAEHGGAVAGEAGHEPQAGEAAHAEPASTELMLMALSIGIGAAGIGIAMFFWLRNRQAANALSKRFAPIYRLLLNKYYVDEIYDAAIVQPIRIVSTGGLWKGVDAGGIDLAVNGVGIGVRQSSSLLRRLQTGSIRAYAASLFLGAVLVLGYYLWK
jgi:NADH-quinone oxidoreductase subunit L